MARQQFIAESTKIFSTGRGLHLRAVDAALTAADAANTTTVQGAEALVTLEEAITAWQTIKLPAWRLSGVPADVHRIHYRPPGGAA